MSKKQNLWLFLMVLIMLLSACAPAPATPAAQPGSSGQNTPMPAGGLVTLENAPFAVAAKAALGQKLRIALDQVRFVSAEAVQWSDSCLGLGGPAESCLQALTPGYKVMFSVQGANYEVRTDEGGKTVRIKE
jgi:hypothetical protein